MRIIFFKKKKEDIYKIKYYNKILTVKSNLKSNFQAHNYEKYRLIKIYIQAI